MTMKKAFHIWHAAAVRAPVVVDVPKDVSMLQEGGLRRLSRRRSRCARTTPVRKATAGQSPQGARTCCCNAKRPYIYTGGGVLLGNATNELRTGRRSAAIRSPTR